MNLASSLPGHDASFDLEYGLAPSGLLAPLLLLAPSLTAIVLVNAIAGALAPAIAAALARAIGLARWPAWLSGLTLAIHPVLVRHGGEANRQPLVLLPALVALWALARHGERGRIGWLLLAACGAALCLGARPEAALLLPLLSLPILACGPGLRETAAELRRGRLNSTARAALLALAITLAWSLLRLPAIPAAALRGTTGDAPRLLGTLLWLDPALTPIPLTMLALLGLALGLRDRRALATLPALVVLSLVVAPYPTEGDQLCNARYHTLTLIPFALLVGLGLERLLERLARPQDLRPRARGLTLALLGLLLALASWGPLRRATAPRSEDLELRFLLETAPTLPPGATVIVVNHGDDALLKSYQLIPRTRAPDQTWLKFHEAKDALQGGWTGGPRVYYHAGACSSDRLRDASRAECDEAARHLRRRPLHVTTLPELHSLAGERRPGRAVELGFYQL
ncbi:MAG: glycosyltransferase family 39 protein [Myxococcales bacterium]|nr:glycosyltransferase family 39 protein [Myxococcales bacterium]